jgi:hypothetical protein
MRSVQKESINKTEENYSYCLQMDGENSIHLTEKLSIVNTPE